MEYIEISTTFTKKKEALELSNKLLNEKLVADAQLQVVLSVFEYKNKNYKRKEYLVNYKTHADLFDKVKNFIIKNHSFEVPQIVAKAISFGSEDYLKWIDENLKKKGKNGKK